MTKSKTAFILKKDWLRFAESAQKSAESWQKQANAIHKHTSYQAWTKEECQVEVDAYMKSYEQHMEQARTAPVKIVLHYEDGRTETIE